MSLVMSELKDDETMRSINFEFLRPVWPDLAEIGGFAEAYAHPDPNSAIAKLRVFCEQTAKFVHYELRLPRLYRPNLIDLLTDASFESAVPQVIVAKLHTLRVEGNSAVHGHRGDTTTALRLLKEAYDLGRWLYVNFGNGKAEDCPDFVQPPEGGAEAVERRKEKRAILQRVTAQEAQLQKLLDELEAERERAEQAFATASELKTALEAGQQAAAAVEAIDPLAFDENQTRQYLIDLMLTDVGWNVGPGGTSTSEVKKELEITGQPTDSGIGYADYVLMDDNGKPLAVIEAKKTSKYAESGRTQAKCYANGLEAMYGQRPVIFYTNGYDLWIWNDAESEPPRKIFAYYSKDSLQHLLFQRHERKPASQVGPDKSKNIVTRMYQFEAVKRVVEAFAQKKRKALIVQATGTGKTRVAIALCDALIQARWAKRILFLCDRRELRKQAHNAFKEFLPSEPRIYVTANTAHDRNQRIYLATYPAMMKVHESFDAGFFDLIIADESHRSLYNRYRQIFTYFDCYQVGLTATPIDFVSKNTFDMFQCGDKDPTFSYTYEEAINSHPPYLVPFEVDTHTTPFLRAGIKYSQMTDEQKRQLEEDEVLPQAIEFEQAEVDRRIFNKDTNRIILRNLMENGIRVGDGSRIGKSIIFARNHDHAILLQNLFEEMYPQYHQNGGEFCRVIDTYDKRADELIDDFKGEGKNPNLTIAISVDMLDTGIDVPEIVNLVFAKPVFSYVKFWQMIGRGTRLRPDLFGPGRDKTHFRIFDHWGNFDRFEQGYETAEPKQAKSLMQNVFESRLEIARVALEKQDVEAFDLAIGLIGKDIAALPDKSIAVREKWQQVCSVRNADVLKRFDAATRATLEQDIAPLMQWIHFPGSEEAHKFDRLIAQLQASLIQKSSHFDDLKDEVINQLTSLPMNLSQVRAKQAVIEKAKSDEFWDHVTVRDLEDLRLDLRGIIQFRPKTGPPATPPKVIDVIEDPALIERKRHKVKLTGLDLVAYRNRVHHVLQDIVDENPTLQKIKAAEPVDPSEIESLCSLVLTLDSGLDLHHLADYFPETAGDLARAIRGIIGMDAIRVNQRFVEFTKQHPGLHPHQIKFLDMIQNHIAKYGSIEVRRLYEPPFTLFHNDSLDGVFDEPLAEEVLTLIHSFEPHGSED
jgi:type I restriction enzyme R subunit